MSTKKLLISLVVGITAAVVIAAVPTQADPIDPWLDLTGNDCTGPEDEGLEPGTPEFQARDERNQQCASQRFLDRSFQPLGNTAPTYGQDPYRLPQRHDDVRFRFDLPVIPGVPSAEVYRPCSNAPGDCPNLPAGLERFDPPYPVVVVFHGFVASKELHRMNTQVFAEHGYLAVGVNGTHPSLVDDVPSFYGPNSQRTENGSDVLDWLATSDHPIAADADLDRVGFAGHSQGGGATLSYQGDPRVHALIVWDGGTTASEANNQPTMYQTAEQGFATPTAFSDVPGFIEAGPGFGDLRSRNVDTFAVTGRATTHVDYNGNGGPGGNRLWESASNYYNLAWFDRYLKGKLAFDASGEVITTGGRAEAQERAHRQEVAEGAYLRLIADTFDDSVDAHNISMGWWDPDQAIESLDPLFGGNVPYRIEGLPIADRLSFYYRHGCYVSVPDYLNGGTGAPDDTVAAAERADTGPEGDVRTSGCTEIQ
jgi:hypothetical protein